MAVYGAYYDLHVRLPRQHKGKGELWKQTADFWFSENRRRNVFKGIVHWFLSSLLDLNKTPINKNMCKHPTVRRYERWWAQLK